MFTGRIPDITRWSAAWNRRSSVPVARPALKALAVGAVVLAAGVALGDPPLAIASSALAAIVVAELPPPIAFGMFVSSAVWKTAPVFGGPDSLLPTFSLLVGWAVAVGSRAEAKLHLGTSARATAIVVPLTVWLFVSASISEMGRSGYVEALRFCTVVVVPSFLVALDLTSRRVASYTTAILAAGAAVAIAALTSAAFTGRLWTSELLLFRENQVSFGRVVALGFVAALCVLPAIRRSDLMAAALAASVISATAVAHSTSRGAAVTSAVCGVVLLGLLILLYRNRWPRRRTTASVAAITVAMLYLVISAISFFPTGRGVRSLVAVPAELPQFVNVPLLSESVATRPPAPASTVSGGDSSGPPASRASSAPSPSPSIFPSPTPDPALVAYEPDLALAYRIERYRIAIAQFISSPIVGLGYTHGVLARDGQEYAHNIELEVASELGVVGLACLALVLVALARHLVRWRQRWEFVAMGVLVGAAFLMAQTSGNLTINRLFFIMSVGIVAMSEKARADAIAQQVPTSEPLAR
jgi:hypothetical protein